MPTYEYMARANSFSWCMHFRIHRFVAAPPTHMYICPLSNSFEDISIENGRQKERQSIEFVKHSVSRAAGGNGVRVSFRSPACILPTTMPASIERGGRPLSYKFVVTYSTYLLRFSTLYMWHTVTIPAQFWPDRQLLKSWPHPELFHYWYWTHGHSSHPALHHWIPYHG